MSNPVLSVCMVTYNHEKYIKQAIESILMQEVNFEYEIIIGEDCSPDNTRKILKSYKEKYPDKFVLVLRDENIGATKNYIDIKNLARGKYIASLEGDDFWNYEKKLQIQIDFLEAHPEYIGIAHQNNTCDEQGVLIKGNERIIKHGNLHIEDFLNYGFLYHTSTLVYKNIFIGSPNKYDALLTSHPLVGDLPMALLLLDRGKIYLMDEKYSTFRKVIKKGGTNAQSIAKSNLMKSMTEQLQQTIIIEEYFQGKYDFSKKKASQIAFLWLTFIPFFTRKTNEDKIKAKKLLAKFDKTIKIKALLFYFYKLKKMIFESRLNNDR